VFYELIDEAVMAPPPVPIHGPRSLPVLT
jgi:hypothetical protein